MRLKIPVILGRGITVTVSPQRRILHLDRRSCHPLCTVSLMVEGRVTREYPQTTTVMMWLSVHFSPLTDWVMGGGYMRNDSAEVLFQSFLQEARVSSSGVGKDVHTLTVSIQHYRCRPWRHLASKARRMVSERLSWRVTNPNQASFCLYWYWLLIHVHIT